MDDPVKSIIAEVTRIAGTLGLPVEIDRPYNLDEKDLPLVVIRTGEEEVVEDDDFPAEGWAVLWKISPSIEVLVSQDDPWVVHDDLNQKWGTLRKEIMKSNVLDLIREGTKPGLRKDMIEIEDMPDIAGFSVTLSFEFERD